MKYIITGPIRLEWHRIDPGVVMMAPPDGGRFGTRLNLSITVSSTTVPAND